MVVAELRERIDGFAAELRSAELSYLRGDTSELAYAKLLGAFPEISDPESFSQVRSAAEASGRTELGKRRLRRVQRFIAAQVEHRLAAEEIAQLTCALSRTETVAAFEKVTPRDAAAGLFTEENREKRGAYAQAIGRVLLDERSFGRRVDASLSAATALGAPDYCALAESLEAMSFAKLEELVAPFLRRAEDAYRDVLAFALKRVHPTVRFGAHGNAHVHDLCRASTAPWLYSEFRRDEVFPSITRWIGEWGFHPSADKRLRFDLNAGGAEAGVRCVATGVPHPVHLVGRSVGGIRDFSELAAAYGPALLLTSLNPEAPVEDRWLVDASVLETFLALLRGVVFDERWLKRYVGAAHAAAREGARSAALTELASLRHSAATFDHERALYTRGVSAQLLDEYADRVKTLVLVGTEPGFGLSSVQAPFASAHRLRGAALAERLRRYAEEHFNEDWWRNPAAATWLKKLFAEGVREDVDTLAAAHGGPPSLEEHAARLVAVLDA